MDIKIDISYKKTNAHWKDSKYRSDHILDRMVSRGIGIDQIREAITKGSKRIRNDGSIVSKYRWFSVIYRELPFENLRKIYPITVIEC